MHTVQGVPRHGLLLDPGAARGLIGTATRDKFEKEVSKHTDYEIRKKPPRATLSGIEGKPQKAHDFCVIPCGIDGDVVDFECDSIGGSGSNCPGLLSNYIFLKLKK